MKKKVVQIRHPTEYFTTSNYLFTSTDAYKRYIIICTIINNNNTNKNINYNNITN